MSEKFKSVNLKNEYEICKMAIIDANELLDDLSGYKHYNSVIKPALELFIEKTNNDMQKLHKLIFADGYDAYKKIMEMEKEIHKIEYIERLTRTPIFSKYTVNDYDKYMKDEGHHINHLSKEAFEYYYNEYEPRIRELGKLINSIAQEASTKLPDNLTINNPFCGCNKEKKRK